MQDRFVQAFARHLRAERSRVGRSQRGLSTDADVALDTVRLVEKGERVPGLDKAVLILRALGRPAWKALRDVEEAVYGDE